MEEDRRHAGFLIRMPMYNGSEGKARLCRILGDEAGGIVLERVRLIWHQAIMSEASNMCDLFRIRSILSCILAGLLRFLLLLTKFVSLGVMFFLDWFPLIVAKPKKGLTVAVLGIGAVGLAVIAEMTNGVDRSIVWLRCCGASGSST
ncbi:hypothetical protein ACET3Z_009556 [Daucus carota]